MANAESQGTVNIPVHDAYPAHLSDEVASRNRIRSSLVAKPTSSVMGRGCTDR